MEEYIETAQPVGSSHIAPPLKVSSATVRSELAALESEGYLVQPHTSAGRIPTELGYRYFVDSLAGPATLGSAQVQQVRQFFDLAHGELEQTLHDTSRLLSDLTDHTAVVTGLSVDPSPVRSLQVVPLSGSVALAVVVLANATVEKRTVTLPDNVGDERLAAAAARLATHLVGGSMHDGVARLAEPTGDVLSDAVVQAVLAAFAEHPTDEESPLYVGGASRMANAFNAVDTVRRVLGLLEQQFVVVTVLRDVLDRGLQVAIGSETGLEPLADCSLVVAPYQVDGEALGSIAVLGPTRMNYPQALAAVAVVSQRLSERLGE